MTDETDLTIRILREIQATQAEHTRTLAEHTRTLAEHTAEFAGIKETLHLHGIRLDNHTEMFADVQDYFSRIAQGLEHLRPPAVPPLGEGSVTEIRQMHSQINAMDRKIAEFQARIEILEGVRNR
jgi:hypothetical protein